MTFLEFVGLAFITLGCFFYFTGVVGLIRFPDVFLRVHAVGKTSTLGIAGLLLGAAVLAPESALQVVALMLFMVMTSPVISHAIAAAAYRSGVRMKHPLRDDLEGVRTRPERVKSDPALDAHSGSGEG